MEKLAGQKVLESLKERFQAFETSLNGQSNSAAHQVRKAAFENLQTKGLPHAKHEEYKFFNLTKALEKNFNFSQSSSPATVNADTVQQFGIEGLEAHKLVLINGVLSAELSDNIAIEGVSIEALQDAFDKENVALFNTEAQFEEDAFVAMNTAFAQNGIQITVADKAVVEKPIMLQFIGASAEESFDYQVRNLINIGKLAEVTIIEKFDTIEGASSFTNIVNEISVAEGAQAKYYKIENDAANTYHIANTHVSQQQNSHFTANTIALDGAMVRNNLNIKLQAENCEAHMNGLYVLGDKTHVDNHTVVDHMMPNAYSNELYKGIMDDKSKGVFNGKIFVRQDAQKTNAFQSNKNILLTNDATVNTKPQLEIWADDVKCSHGCTTGQLDRDALFYLQARGIQKDKARAILLHAFASDVIENFEIEAIQQYVEAIITERLAK
ncbi:Fe-S cluster assembly protein SufD [Roseivirga pacifica]|uniref:Fe-S cluster assembly protein SufD n=1 Tax=Roseivirga pacifica TaxID=1267423 RepID=UPI0020949A51|nr:Fe-S cluster assembly protein SufD [Roseivirga pacifica]MCO6358458.1 Fe-S cluster assembly protein SufD [Roseivirga pacifica]MCO6369013.1 Fe-S cluster assembly protein SufD [Roseivirga pacifica]MCO6372283.1 Fe-S cluster assembly protein SufD [Roseivirga pacifica]MCO6374189.1 Fe-S cluster assembly protein SufD [Roseivirga pacifica]MCO6381014.1 Fe-S cluster assembly protein SufD [Roseivirga pacifica]